MSYIGRGLQSGAFRQLDDISSGFDGSDTTHTMQVNSTNVTVGDVNQILLSLGGVIQKPGTDFTVSASVLTFTTAPASGLSFFAILLGSDNGGTVTPTDGSVTPVKLNLNDTVTITTDDNTDTLTLKSTDADGNSGPILRLNRDSGSPADGDVIGEIHFNADDDAGNTTSFFSMSGNIRDASNGDEDVQMVFSGFRGGSNVNYLEFDGDHVVFNEGSADIDFRVESNSNTHMLFVDGGNNRVGIGTTPDLGVGLHIRTSDTGASVSASADELVIESAEAGGNGGITILSPTDGQGNIFFGDSGDNDIGKIAYNHGTEKFFFITGAAERFTLVGGDAITAAISSDATTDTTVALNLLKANETHSTASRMLSFEVGGQGRGFILNGTGDSSNPAFGAGSDRRLKKNITAYTGGYDKIKSVPVQTWDEQFTDATGLKGWIADELETVFPEAVTGTKDATRTVTNAIISEHGNCLKQNVTEEEFDELKGKEIYKNCTWSASKVVPAFQLSMPDKLFPDVVQALQAAITKIETLEADVKTLKGE